MQWVSRSEGFGEKDMAARRWDLARLKTIPFRPAERCECESKSSPTPTG